MRMYHPIRHLQLNTRCVVIDSLIETKITFTKVIMIIFAIFICCYLLTVLNGQPLQDCATIIQNDEDNNFQLSNCIMANLRSNEHFQVMRMCVTQNLCGTSQYTCAGVHRGRCL